MDKTRIRHGIAEISISQVSSYDNSGILSHVYLFSPDFLPFRFRFPSDFFVFIFSIFPLLSINARGVRDPETLLFSKESGIPENFRNYKSVGILENVRDS